MDAIYTYSMEQEVARRNRYQLGDGQKMDTAGGFAPPLQRALRTEGRTAQELWHQDTQRLPELERTLGSAGVAGDPWDMVEVLLDNARFPVNVAQADGIFRFNLTTSQQDASGAAYVWRRLAAVREIAVQPFSWPTLPAPQQTMLTNRAEVTLLIREISNRAPASDVGVRHHFRGRLSTWETTALMFHRSAAQADIVDAIARSIAACAEFYNSRIELQPPVNLDSLTLEIRRGERLVNFLPFRMTVGVTIVSGVANGSSITRTDGAAIELEADQTICFESDVVDGTTGAVRISAGAAVSVFAASVGATALLTGTITSNAVTATYTVAVPARRVQIALKFVTARVQD
jgi:hypothetical protein